MRGTWAIARRDLIVAFTTPLAYLAIGAFVLMSAVVFWLGVVAFETAQQRALTTGAADVIALLDFNNAIVGGVLLQAQVLLLFVVPLLTMRAFAQDNQHDVHELLMQAPVTSSAIVLGKALAVLVLLCAISVSLALFPLLLALLGRAVRSGDGVIDVGQAAIGIGGVCAVGALYAAIGLVVSAVARSPGAAALATSLVLVVLWFAGGAAPALDGSAANFVGWFAPASHLERSVRGVVTVADAGYFVSVIAACLWVCTRLLQHQRRA